MTEVSFGEWLRRQRKALDLTQEQLAQQINCSTSALRKIEAEERRPSEQIVEQLAETFNIPSSERANFLKFARGNWEVAVRVMEEAAPWRIPPQPESDTKSLTVPSNNLPNPLTSFIGRGREIAEVKYLLSISRLLTLTGAGGSGKTRLALHVATDLLDSFKNGVWWVELASLTDETLVSQAVAKAVGMREIPNQTLAESLTNFLRSKQLLLVLDNCEHLITGCAQLAEQLLTACPKLKILATSREALRLAGESTWYISTLSVPAPQVKIEVDSLMEYEAIRLFVERAAAVKADFALTRQNAAFIAQVCQLLDGIPLAIELAAARVKALNMQQILTRLDDRFDLLTSGSRTALPRQQTLRAAIDWSYDLLTDREQMLFQRLSVFAGGCTLAAAEAVCSSEDIESDEVLDLLSQLVNKSLIIMQEGEVEARYHMLETIRQYARDKLLESGESEQVRDRHLAFFLHFAERAEPKLRSGEQIEWLERVETEHDNLRTALAWSLESGKSDRALDLAGALGYFWELRGLSEGLKWLDEALALSEREPRETDAEKARRAKALYAAGRNRFMLLFEPTTSRTIVEESLQLWREIGDKWWMAVALEHIGFCFFAEGDVQTARARAEEGVSLAREVEDQWPLALGLARLPYYVAMMDVAEGRRMNEEVIAVVRRVDDKSILIQALGPLVGTYITEGNFTAAASLLEEALAEARTAGDFVHQVLTLLLMVIVACSQDDFTNAKDYSFQMLTLSQDMGAPQWQLLSLIGFGLVAMLGGQPKRGVRWGVRLFAATDTLLRQHGIQMNILADVPGNMILKQAPEKARAQLGSEAFEAAWTEGQQLTLEQALALATEEESEDSPPPKDGVASSSDS